MYRGPVSGDSSNLRFSSAHLWYSHDMVMNTFQDLRLGVRLLAKDRVFATLAILTLALGIGANTAIFSVANTVLFQPLPYPQPDRILVLETSVPGIDDFEVSSIPKYMIWREQTQVLAETALCALSPEPDLSSGDKKQQLTTVRASSGFFHLFGAQAALGRTFSSSEDVPGGPHLAVLSSGFWHDHYGADPTILNKNMEIGGQVFQVIGVLDAGFRWMSPVDVWLPLQADPNNTDQTNNFLAFARLAPRVSLEQARSALIVAYQIFRRRFPDTQAAVLGFTADVLEDYQAESMRASLLFLLGAAALLLLISCATVANLQLVRTEKRSGEIAIRLALGADRARILRQLVIESLPVCVASGALGFGLGYLGMHFLLALDAADISRIGPRGAYGTLDWHVLAFSAVSAMVTVPLFALVPAVRVSASSPAGAIAGHPSRSSGGRGSKNVRNVLVVAEILLAFSLTAGSVLLIRTSLAIRALAPGFDAHNVFTTTMWFDGGRFEKSASVAQVVRDGVDALKSIPGVDAVATTSTLPLGPTYHETFTIEGRPVPTQGYHDYTSWRSISPEYFSALRIPLLRGRSFDERDTATSMPVVLINETLAKSFWPDSNPLGGFISIAKGEGPPLRDPPRQIVGVVGDVRDDELDRTLIPSVYVPVSQVSDSLTAFDIHVMPTWWVIRTSVPPSSLSAAVRNRLQGMSTDLSVGPGQTMEEVLSQSDMTQDFNATLMSVFAGAALLLAAVGIYGLMAYSIQHRSKEIAIRMALGESSSSIVRMVVAEGARIAAIGVSLGIAAALALTRLMASMIFGVKPWDGMTFLTVSVLLSLVAAIAVWVPSLRAAALDVSVALRYE